MKTIKGDLIMEKNMTFNEDLIVKGDILGKNGNKFNLRILGDLNCNNLNCLNLDCLDLNCLNLNFYATAIAYNSFRCKTWKARRRNYLIKCLDGKIRGKREK